VSVFFFEESAFIWLGNSKRDIPFLSAFSPLGLDDASRIFLGLEGYDLDPVEFPLTLLSGSEGWILPFRESVSEINFSKLE